MTDYHAIREILQVLTLHTHPSYDEYISVNKRTTFWLFISILNNQIKLEENIL